MIAAAYAETVPVADQPDEAGAGCPFPAPVSRTIPQVWRPNLASRGTRKSRQPLPAAMRPPERSAAQLRRAVADPRGLQLPVIFRHPHQHAAAPVQTAIQAADAEDHWRNGHVRGWAG